MLYVGHLARAGTIRAENMQQYMSAINKVHADLDLSPPALGSALSSIRHGLALQQQDAFPTDQRLALPAAVALAALRIGRAAAGRCIASPQAYSPTDAALLRACVVLVLQFVTFCRPHTAAALLGSDCGIGSDAVVLRLRREKLRAGEHERRVIRLDTRFLAGPIHLLRMWLQCRDLWGIASSSFLYQLRSESAPTSASVGAWVQAAVKATGFQAPAGYKISGYCTRKGAATAAHSVGVPITLIKHFGGWAIGSNVVMDYIDVSVPPSPAAALFFGYLDYGGGRARPSPSLDEWLQHEVPLSGLPALSLSAEGPAREPLLALQLATLPPASLSPRSARQALAVRPPLGLSPRFCVPPRGILPPDPFADAVSDARRTPKLRALPDIHLAAASASL
jgi:hypothetical protein